MTSAPPAWRRLGLEKGPARALVARGPELLAAIAEEPTPTLRWYVPTDAAIVVGRGLPPLPNPQLPVVQRMSGGGAVLLDRDTLSLDVVLPSGHPLLGEDLAPPARSSVASSLPPGRSGDPPAEGLHAAFDVVGNAWADALRDLGLRGISVHPGPNTARRRGGDRERLLAAICFATVGRGEVLVEGRKLVGLAQRRTRHGALVQCGLLWRWKPAPLLAALGAPPADPEIENAATGLRDGLTATPDLTTVVDAVEASLRRHLPPG